MPYPTSPFPGNSKGDVKIVLSDRPEDVLMLNTTVLAGESPFFKASLERLEWSYNKNVTVNAGRETEHSYKLLELDLDGDSTFPLLVGKVWLGNNSKRWMVLTNVCRASRRPLLRSKQKRQTHDRAHSQPWGDGNPLYPFPYNSEAVILAYKIGIAMMCGQRLQFPPNSIHMASSIVPVVVDFADAYGLLPGWNDKILALIFESDRDAYGLMAELPFPYLKIAYKLKSKSIYQEAMLHAIGLYNKYESREFLRDVGFFRDTTEELYAKFQGHAKKFADNMNEIAQQLLILQPQFCRKIPAARHIGLAIFRDWLAVEAYQSTHHAILKILEHDYDIADMITSWPPRKDNQVVGLKFGHIHRTIENCFKEAYQQILNTFSRGRPPRAKPKEHRVKDENRNSGDRSYYCANIHFPDDYKYPWEEEEEKAGGLTFMVYEMVEEDLADGDGW